MTKNESIRFFRNILKELFISTYVIENPETYIAPEIDLCLRRELFGCDDYAAHLTNSFSAVRARTVYRFFDEYDCHYVFLKIADRENAYFFAGPYLTDIPTSERLAQFSSDETTHAFLTRYYAALPILEDENLLLSMMTALAKELWQCGDDIAMEFMDYAIPDRREPIAASFLGRTTRESDIDLRALEQNYENERILMEAVSSGKLHKLTALASSVYRSGAERRLPDSLRDRKNYLIILKTLLRKAAEYGGVHPLHIHRLTSEFAAEIENLHTIRQSMTLQEHMIRDYCLLVREHSLSPYSLNISRTVALVQYDLTADLRLCSIAKKLSVNASYLSDLFHREYGCTLSEFVSRERINHAMHLLKNTKKSVQEIAADCGILDASYFTRLFKKQTGMTPLRYRETVRSKK